MRRNHAACRVRHLSQFLLVATGAALWFVGFPSGIATITPPSDPAFWGHLVNLASLGFGYTIPEPWSGTVVLVALPALMAWRLATLSRLAEPERTRWFTLLLGTAVLLLTLALISAGRARFGPDQAKSSRYAVFSLVLLPAFWLLGREVLQRLAPRRRTVATSVFGIALAAGYVDDYYFHSYYREPRQMRADGIACIRRYYQKTGDGRCPTLFPDVLDSRLDRALALRIPFAVRAASPDRAP